MSRIPYLQKTKSKAEGRQAYLRRIASIQDDTSAGPRPAGLSARGDGLNASRSVLQTLLKWFVRIVLVGLLIGLVALAFYLWGPWAQPGSAPAVAELASALTARQAHLAAEPIARTWADDAQLVSLSATWDAGQAFQDGQGDWSLLYYSPARSATALISVNDGTVTMIGDHGVGQPIGLSSANGWRIDSPKAIELLRAAGGDDFLRSQPDVTVSMSLDLSQDGVWRVRLIDQMSRRVFAARVRSDSGEIIGIEQSG